MQPHAKGIQGQKTSISGVSRVNYGVRGQWSEGTGAGQRPTTNRGYEGGQSVIQKLMGKQGKENPLELGHI